ncbi:MAG: flagellar brake protein [Planctomycetota bacterium]
MKGSIVAVLCALLFVFAYTSTVTQLVSNPSRSSPPEGFLKNLRWKTSSEATVRRYVGFTAISVAVALITWLVFQHFSNSGRSRPAGSRRRVRWSERTPSRPARSPLPSPAVAPVRHGVEPSVDPLAPLETNLEVDLFGSGNLAGQCGRGVLVKRDASSIVFRLASHSESIPWRPGDRLHGYFWLSPGHGFLFECEVLDRRADTGVYLVATLPARLVPQQRRVYIRVACREGFRFLHIRESDSKDWLAGHRAGGSQEFRYEGMAEDLSAGGFRMVTNAPLAEGDYISITHFRPAGATEILGRVSVQLGSYGSDFARYGVQFMGLEANARDQITREVFRMQRELLRARFQDDSITDPGRASSFHEKA